jgi:hypothetical protein
MDLFNEQKSLQYANDTKIRKAGPGMIYEGSETVSPSHSGSDSEYTTI